LIARSTVQISTREIANGTANSSAPITAPRGNSVYIESL
jgi:hypothetical protein